MKQRSKKEEAKLQEEIKKYQNLPRTDRRKKKENYKKNSMIKVLQLNVEKNSRNQKHYLVQNVEHC